MSGRPGTDPESEGRRRPHASGPSPWAWAGLVSLGLVVHGWFIAGATALDTDRATVLLMARRFAQGDFSLYFWQQNYMAALEPLLMTPAALVGLATPVAAGVVALTLTGLLAWLSLGLTRRAGGLRWVTLLLWAAPPAIVVHHHVSLYGARLAATVLVLWALARALDAETRREWVVVGFFTGMAYFADHLMLPWAAGVAWVVLARRGLAGWVLGILPPLAVDTVAAVLTPAFHLSGPNDPGHWIWNLPRLVAVTVPQLFGLLPDSGPQPVYRSHPSPLPEGALEVLGAVVGLVALGGLLWVAMARGPRGEERSEERRLILEALALAVGVTGGLYAFVGGGGDPWTVRYLVPLWPALSVGVARVLVAVPTGPRRLLALGLVVPAVVSWTADASWPPRGGAASDGAEEEVEVVSRALEEADAEVVWADYWDAYRWALLVGEPPYFAPLNVIDRRPRVTAEGLVSRPAAYLLPREATATRAELEERRIRQGVALLDRRPVGRFELTVTDRPVAGMISMPSPPDRGWQMLAALSAGVLFFLMVVGVRLLFRLLRGARPGPG